MNKDKIVLGIAYWLVRLLLIVPLIVFTLEFAGQGEYRGALMFLVLDIVVITVTYALWDKGENIYSEREKKYRLHYIDVVKSPSHLKRIWEVAKPSLIKAHKALESEDYKEAKIWYSIALDLCPGPGNWEALFYKNYCEVKLDILKNPKIISIWIKSVLAKIKTLEATEQNEAINQIYAELHNLIWYWSTINSFEGIKASIPFPIDEDAGFFRTVRQKKEYDESLETFYYNYILELTDMLKLFGDKLVSEIGKNELTNSIKIKCYEDILEAFPILFNDYGSNIVNGLRMMNPSSQALMKYENRSFFTKNWKDQNSKSRTEFGCTGCFTFFIIWIVLFNIFVINKL
jgi:hypothetical protein